MTKNYHHLYGPVPSRRLGRSLGVDLVPHKVCTYDCIYCQIGKTTEKTLLRKEYVPTEEVISEVRAFLSEGHSSIDYISLGGSGEPTLHSRIRDIIRGIKAMTSIPVAVITNGALLSEEDVRKDLLQADAVLPSLDAATPGVFARINRPCFDLSVEKVIRGLAEFRRVYRGRIWLEILFCKGVNDRREELIEMKRAVDRIMPDKIHLNSVVRPPSETWAAPLAKNEMGQIRAFFGEKASIISEYDRHISPPSDKEVADRILNILRRRPLSLSDLCQNMGISQHEMEGYVRPLIEEGRVHVRLFQDAVYYEAAIE